MKEVFKEVNINNNYHISNFGRVYSDYKDGFLSQYITNKGYNRLTLIDENGNEVKKLVHRLVAEHFIGEKPSENHQINHKDLNKTNNKVNNLEWVTCKENVNHKINNDKDRLEYLKKEMSKIGKKYNHLGVEASKKPVVQKDKNTGDIINIFESAREASRETGAKYRSISKVCKGKRNTHIGFKWKFLKDEDATTIEKRDLISTE